MLKVSLPTPMRLFAKQLSSRHCRRYSTIPEFQSSDDARRKITIRDIHSLYAAQKPIVMLTAHDYASATYLEAAGNIDMCLVGDSLAMVSCGYDSTVQLPLEELLYHCRAVARGVETSLLIADMPFGSYQTSEEQSRTNAVRIIKEGNMEAVKIEGGVEVAPLIRHLSSHGIPVMGHIGLTPQRQAALSGYRVQGRDAAAALRIYEDSQAVAQAGAFSLVLEAIPHRLAAYITSALSIPTIGIGAGSGCSGQVLVQQDALGGFRRFSPRFAKKYLDLAGLASAALRNYADEVTSHSFPADAEHGYAMQQEQWLAFLRSVQRKE